MHIPKTGGSTFTAAIAPYLRIKKKYPKNPEDAWHGWQVSFHRGAGGMHKGIHHTHTRKLVEHLKSEKFIIMTILRNPYDWFFSKFHSFNNGLKLEEFAKKNIPDWLPNQSSQVVYKGKFYPDVYLRCEHLHEDMCWFFERLGLPIPENKKYNPTNRNAKEDMKKLIYNDALLRQVNKNLFPDFSSPMPVYLKHLYMIS